MISVFWSDSVDRWDLTNFVDGFFDGILVRLLSDMLIGRLRREGGKSKLREC